MWLTIRLPAYCGVGLEPESWTPMSLVLKALTMAMTALGTETSLDKFRQAGARPFVLAGLLYVWLVAGGYFVTKYVVGML